jgi:TorA maturation chaperone TorD
MENLQESMAETLAARYYLYSTAQALLGNEPTAEMLDAAAPEMVEAALEACGVEGAAELAGSFAATLEGVQCEGGLIGLSAQYTRLFVGPGKLACPPWESVYRSNSRALFQRSTLDVRNAYREQGLLPQMYPRVADDHIALELGFLAQLAKRAMDAHQAEDTNACKAALEASARFASEHLNVWLVDYASDLQKEAPDSLYAAVAHLAQVFCARDVLLTGEAAVLLP